VAVTDNAMSIMLNPSGLGFNRTFEGYVIANFDSSEFRDETHLFFRGSNIGFGAQLFGQSKNYNAFSLGMGSQLGNNFYLGSSFRWFTRINRKSEWNVGLMYRPSNLISLGMSAKNINYPGEFKPEYIVGAGLRPFGNRFTLSVDAIFESDEINDYSDDIKWISAIQFEPFDGIILKGNYSREAFGIGIGLNLKHIGIEGYTNFNEDGDITDGYTITHISADEYRTFLKVKRKKWITLTFKGPIIEERRESSLFGKRHSTLLDIVEIIRDLREDPEVEGLYIKMYGLKSGFSKKQEIREALERFKKNGKKIICYSESMENSEYYLASVADSIFMNPSGSLMLTGIHMEIPFIKGTLDKIGIEPQIERIGKYKSAGDIITADSMPPPFREARNAIIDCLYSHFVSTIAESRDMTNKELKNIIDNGPYTAKQAEDRKLIDMLLYEDEVGERFKKNNIKLVSLKRYTSVKDYVYDWQPMPKNRIALIYATGSIVSGKSGSNVFSGDLMGSETIAKAIRDARKDDNIKAILLRIDSGGGSGLASDVIWREVKKTTEGENKKPFIVSMSDVAGSGGYYIACAADIIIADETTITGSIGVLGGKFNLKSMYDKIGLKFETIQRGKHSAMFSSKKPFTEEEKRILREMITEFYQDFIHKVAEGRGLSVSYVDSIGRGRIWTGNQARENGLIDELGGLNEAISLAKRKAGFSEDDKVKIEIYPKYAVKLFDFGFGPISGKEAYLPEDLLNIARDYGRYTIYENENILYIMPYNINIK
jgi:protease-4